MKDEFAGRLFCSDTGKRPVPCFSRVSCGRSVSQREPAAAVVAFRQKMEREHAKQIYGRRGSLVDLAFAWLKSGTFCAAVVFVSGRSCSRHFVTD